MPDAAIGCATLAESYGSAMTSSDVSSMLDNQLEQRRARDGSDAASIPAATLVLFRDKPGASEHLFVERAAKMVFAAGAVVFPGGRVDPADHALAMRYPDMDPGDAAARIAAMRETIEEVGVAVGLPDSVDVAALRLELARGAAFGDLLDTAGLILDLSGLTPFARWCPNFRESRTFDTRFYLAKAPAAADASVDGTENVHLFWATARDVLDRADAGTVKIIFPTRRNLERLATLVGLDAAIAHARGFAEQTITPWIEEREGIGYLCIPMGLGYPVTASSLSDVVRG